MPLEDFIITTYCLVDQTMEVIGEFLGQDTDSGIWRYFREHWLDWFPQLGSRSNFAKHAANLWHVKQYIQNALVKDLQGNHDQLYMADGFPIAVCHLSRAKNCELFSDSVSYGYCASKSERYYGFKGNLVINSTGLIVGMTATAAQIDERVSLWDILGHAKNLLIADKGFIGDAYHQEVYAHTLRFRNFKKMILAAMFRRMLNSGQYCCGHYRI
ncbi:IS982 family transposase [Piscirickettsia salmonis]|uniref:IS982 family transposase n=1 Tax=Piscirickettsia salmonis TaxID=1238 RepID=UPI00068A0A5D|nr:IS982 family transposase [Piscirickettsia salmonis]